jgi:hypothetical protein
MMNRQGEEFKHGQRKTSFDNLRDFDNDGVGGRSDRTPILSIMATEAMDARFKETGVAGLIDRHRRTSQCNSSVRQSSQGDFVR